MKQNPTVHAIGNSLLSMGSEMRQLRLVRKLTLNELSTSSGVSRSHLSAIERGASQPSMDVLRNIADALSVTPDWFFARRPGAGPMEQACVVRAQNRRNLNSLYGENAQDVGYTDNLLSSTIGGDFYMGLAVYAPNAKHPLEPMKKHEG